MIFADGFLSEGATGWGAWERLLGEKYPEATVYRLTWGAKELKSLNAFLTPAVARLPVAQAATTLAAQAAKTASKRLGPLSAVFNGASLAREPLACGEDPCLDAGTRRVRG